MNILEIGTQLIQEKFGSDISVQGITDALGNLLGAQDGGIDVQQLLSKFMGSGGLGDMVSSWLGDGANDAISMDQVKEIFGGEKITEFASKIGVGADQAAEGLSDIIPQMIDKVSSGGNLLDNVGDLGGVLDMAKKFF